MADGRHLVTASIDHFSKVAAVDAGARLRMEPTTSTISVGRSVTVELIRDWEALTTTVLFDDSGHTEWSHADRLALTNAGFNGATFTCEAEGEGLPVEAAWTLTFTEDRTLPLDPLTLALVLADHPDSLRDIGQVTWTRKGTVDCREPLTNAVAPDLIAFIGADGLQPDGTFEPFDTAPPAVAIDLLSFGLDEDGWGVIIAVVTELVEGPATMNVRMFPTADTEDVSNMVSCRYGEDGDAVDQVCQDFASGIPVPLRAADIDGNAFSQTLPLKVVNGELVVDLDPSETSDDATVEVVVVSLQVGPVGASYLINANALVEAWFAV